MSQPSERRTPDPPVSRDEDTLQKRIQAEFREMPGLRLTVAQAARLFSVEPRRCERILDDLVDAGRLACDGQAFAASERGRRSA